MIPVYRLKTYIKKQCSNSSDYKNSDTIWRLTQRSTARPTPAEGLPNEAMPVRHQLTITIQRSNARKTIQRSNARQKSVEDLGKEAMSTYTSWRLTQRNNARQTQASSCWWVTPHTDILLPCTTPPATAKSPENCWNRRRSWKRRVGSGIEN